MDHRSVHFNAELSVDMRCPVCVPCINFLGRFPKIQATWCRVQYVFNKDGDVL